MLIWYSKHQPKPSCSNGCAALSPSPGAAQAGVSDTMHYNQASFVPPTFSEELVHCPQQRTDNRTLALIFLRS